MFKIQQVFTVFSLFLLMQACHAEPEGHKKKLSGSYIYGHEVNTFKPCAQNKVYWVLGDDKMLNTLKKHYNTFSSKPYSRVYVEILAEFKDKGSDGYAMDYDGQVLVKKMLKMEPFSESLCK